MSRIRIFKKKNYSRDKNWAVRLQPICIAPWLNMQEAEKTVEVLQIILQQIKS